MVVGYFTLNNYSEVTYKPNMAIGWTISAVIFFWIGSSMESCSVLIKGWLSLFSCFLFQRVHSKRAASQNNHSSRRNVATKLLSIKVRWFNRGVRLISFLYKYSVYFQKSSWKALILWLLWLVYCVELIFWVCNQLAIIVLKCMCRDCSFAISLISPSQWLSKLSQRLHRIMNSRISLLNVFQRVFRVSINASVIDSL